MNRVKAFNVVLSIVVVIAIIFSVGSVFFLEKQIKEKSITREQADTIAICFADRGDDIYYSEYRKKSNEYHYFILDKEEDGYDDFTDEYDYDYYVKHIYIRKSDGTIRKKDREEISETEYASLTKQGYTQVTGRPSKDEDTEDETLLSEEEEDEKGMYPVEPTEVETEP